MFELGVDKAWLRTLFRTRQDQPFVLVEVDPSMASTLSERLGVAVRRCYITDELLAERQERVDATAEEIIRAKVPDAGSVMSGDFGEILTALFQVASEDSESVFDPIKWRLKQDRTKAAPMADVVQFVLPRWPNASGHDRLICSEVKTKATSGTSRPVEAAISDSQKDSSGRLLKTLLWLRERALDTGHPVQIGQLDRFIKADENPPAVHDFRAVVVIESSLAPQETNGLEAPPAEERTLVIISVPDLKENYQLVYEAAISNAEGAASTAPVGSK